jgi:hypothetical protein
VGRGSRPWRRRIVGRRQALRALLKRSSPWLLTQLLCMPTVAASVQKCVSTSGLFMLRVRTEGGASGQRTSVRGWLHAGWSPWRLAVIAEIADSIRRGFSWCVEQAACPTFKSSVMESAKFDGEVRCRKHCTKEARPALVATNASRTVVTQQPAPTPCFFHSGLPSLMRMSASWAF